jgi:hypothetical protein
MLRSQTWLIALFILGIGAAAPSLADAPPPAPPILDAAAYQADLAVLQAPIGPETAVALVPQATAIEAKWANGDPVLFARLMETASGNLRSSSYDPAVLVPAKHFAEAGLRGAKLLPLDLEARLTLSSAECTFRDEPDALARGKSGMLTQDIQAYVAMWHRVR